VAIPGGDQKEMPLMIIELVLVDALNACTIDDINQFEKIMLVCLLGTLVQLFENDLERLV
jgi:hypothetical protein